MPAKGMNINLGDLGDKYDEAMQTASNMGAAYHLVMTVPPSGVNSANEVNEITRWRDAVAPTKLIWRTYSTLEGNWVKMIGYADTQDMYRDNIDQYIQKCQSWARKKVAEWRSEGLKDIIRDDPICEPQLAGGDKRFNEYYVIRSVTLVNEAKKHGFTVAIGAFSVGTPHEARIDDGTYDQPRRITCSGETYGVLRRKLYLLHRFCRIYATRRRYCSYKFTKT